MTVDADRKPLVLVGFMASGKSTVGELLAQNLSAPFFDTDTMIEESFGMSIAEIFRTEGEAAFRQAERELITSLLGSGLRVVASGGGAFIDPVTRTRLASRAHTIWLDTSFDLIRTRLAQCSNRPIASAKSSSQLQELWQERRPFYAKADLRIDAGDRTAAAIVERIIEALALS